MIMNRKNIFINSILGHERVCRKLLSDTTVVEKAVSIATAIETALRCGGKAIFAGNGGSAADAQHLAAEFVGRFKMERAPLAAISLATDTSILTAVGNDYGYDEIFIRQVLALAKQEDIIVLISTSGNSANLINVAEYTKDVGIATYSLLGKTGGKLKSLSSDSIIIESDDTARIQEMHIMLGHIICDIVEQSINEKGKIDDEWHQTKTS